MIPLPPKRFQPADNPFYDPIRHKPWFEKLIKRRVKIPFLRAARAEYLEGYITNGVTQAVVAEKYGIDERELRDYCAFVENQQLVPMCSMKQYQHIIDDAYTHYQGNNAADHLRTYLESQALFWGVNPRHVTELWEVDPCYYPTGYQHRICAKCGHTDAMVKHSDGKWYCHHTHDL